MVIHTLRIVIREVRVMMYVLVSPSWHPDHVARIRDGSAR